MTLSQKIALNTVVQFVGRIFTAVSALITTMLISWKLGAEGLGQYIRVISYITIWFVLLDFGINPIAVKAISKITDLKKQKKSLRENYRMLLGLRGAVTIFILAIATGILFILPGETYTPVIRQAIMIAYIQIIGQSIVSSSMPIFQITLSYFRATLSNLIGSVVSLILVAIVVWRNGSIVNIILASMSGWVLIALATYYFAVRKTGFVLPEINLKKWKILLKQAFPVGIALLFNVVFVKLNMQLLQVLKLNTEVIEKYGNIDAQTGFYGIALRFFDIMITLPFFFSNAIYPILVQRKEESIESLRNFMNKSVNIMVMLGLPMAAGGIILAPQIIYYVSGGFLPDASESEFLPAIPALRMLLSGLGLFFTTGVTTWIYIIMDKQKLLPKVYGIILIITLVLNLILLPKFGYLGAAVVTIIGEICVFLFHMYYSNKLINFKYDWRYFIKTAIASIIMGAAIYPFRNYFIAFPLILGMLMFGAIGYILKILDAELLLKVMPINKIKSKLAFSFFRSE